jgi:hypothetical protein
MIKIILSVVIVLFLTGCCEEFPVPEEAVKACLEAGKIPNYSSSISGIVFTCKDGDIK